MTTFDLSEFEEFDRHGRPISDQPIVTIQKTGDFGMNDAAYAALGSPPAIKLLYSRTKQIIAFKPADPEEPNAYPIRAQRNKRSFIIAGRAFALRYNIRTGQMRRLRAQVQDNVLIIDLKQESLSKQEQQEAEATA